MKAKLIEHSSCFEILLNPETMEEAAQVIRFGINGKKELVRFSADAHRDFSISGYLLVGKRSRESSAVMPCR